MIGSINDNIFVMNKKTSNHLFLQYEKTFRLLNIVFDVEKILIFDVCHEMPIIAVSFSIHFLFIFGLFSSYFIICAFNDLRVKEPTPMRKTKF